MIFKVWRRGLYSVVVETAKALELGSCLRDLVLQEQVDNGVELLPPKGVQLDKGVVHD